jgi:hypothetical protein
LNRSAICGRSAQGWRLATKPIEPKFSIVSFVASTNDRREHGL